MTTATYNHIIYLYMTNQHESALTAAYRLLDSPIDPNGTDRSFGHAAERPSGLTAERSFGHAAERSSGLIAERSAFLLLVGSVCHQSCLMDNAQDFYRGALRLLESTPSCDTAVYARFNLASVVALRDLREARELHCQIDTSAPAASDALFQHGMHLQHQRLFAK